MSAITVYQEDPKMNYLLFFYGSKIACMENNRLEKYNNKRSSYLGSLIKELVDAGGFTVNDVATYIDVSEEELDIIYTVIP